MDWLGGRLLYWFQNCSEEQGVEGPLESEEVEDGVDEAEETEEARDLRKSGSGCGARAVSDLKGNWGRRSLSLPEGRDPACRDPGEKENVLS